MSRQEVDDADRSLAALNDALRGLGFPAVDSNSDFLRGEPVVGAIPNWLLCKPTVAPLKFVLGRELDVWLGPFSEVLLLNPLEDADDTIAGVQKILGSYIAVENRKRSTVITIFRHNEEPWRRLKVSGSRAAALPPLYEPYAQGCW